MSFNEGLMKSKGEEKAWKSITKKSGDFKNISSTQIGQQLIFSEALRVLPEVRDWIENGSAKTYRLELQNYFYDDDFLLEKIAQSYLFLAGSIYNSVDKRETKRIKTRHRKIRTLESKILIGLDFNQVWRFTEVIIQLSEHFSVESILTSSRNRLKWSIRYNCSLSEVILSQVSFEAIQSFYPLPMTTPPLDWSFKDGILIGGYETYQYELVRATPKIKDYSVFSKNIFDSVNYIQSTPWIVNRDIVKVLNSDLKMPKREDYVKDIYPDKEPCKFEVDIKDKSLKLTKLETENIEGARKEFSDKVELYNAELRDYESAVGKYRAVKMALQIAEKYIDDTIYFPHSYDFRGRIYPIPVGLNPQGSDAVKALLLYKNTKLLTESGEKWNWAYLASLYGDDKLHFEDRVSRGKELLYVDYKEADEPYQFLSHQLELRKFQLDSNYIPNTRIHLDACNSGSQFTSAITGDKAGCLATNVIPSFSEDGLSDRKDAYLLVANKALELSKERADLADTEESRELYEFFSELLEKDGRKICKVPVMVSNYGGTTGGRADILWNMFRELGVDRKWINRKNASNFSRVIGDSITGVLNGGKAFETYIQEMNNLIARSNKAVTWTTMDGFYVVHVKNKELKSRQISCMLPGARRKTTLSKKVFSDKVSSMKMKSAISPNYIHSLDAELLRRVALNMRNEGIVDSDWIHDSFGCHPNDVNLMLEITKNQFSILIKRSPLRKLDKQLRAQVEPTKKNIRDMNKISMPNLRGFDIKRGDLNVVKDSEWFFS